MRQIKDEIPQHLAERLYCDVARRDVRRFPGACRPSMWGSSSAAEHGRSPAGCDVATILMPACF
jgi:hypothetical protein